MDDAADATEKERQEFFIASSAMAGKRTYLSSLKHFNLKVENNWFTNNGTQADTTHQIKLNGELVPHSIYMVPPPKNTSKVSYTLARKYAVLRMSAGIPITDDRNDPPGSPLTFEVLGDGKSLWKSKPITERDTFQTCEIIIEKVNVLTLQVYCPGGNNSHAHATWIEPILVE